MLMTCVMRIMRQTTFFRQMDMNFRSMDMLNDSQYR